MQDTMSLLIATTILAAGGLGLYMYKSSDEHDYNEDNLFSSNSFWNTNHDENENENDAENIIDNENHYDEEEYYAPKVKTRGGKTKRNRKQVGTKRRY